MKLNAWQRVAARELTTVDAVNEAIRAAAFGFRAATDAARRREYHRRQAFLIKLRKTLT